jgi:hypothetical protein
MTVTSPYVRLNDRASSSSALHFYLWNAMGNPWTRINSQYLFWIFVYRGSCGRRQAGPNGQDRAICIFGGALLHARLVHMHQHVIEPNDHNDA